MDQIIGTIKDSNLRLTLAFGIGIHHAGLQERDRKTVEELFVNQKIQVSFLIYFNNDLYLSKIMIAGALL